MLGVDPHNPKRAVAGHAGLAASLSDGYLGTECSTGVGGEPDRDDAQMRSIPLNTFKRRKTVALTFAASTNGDGIAYSFGSKFVLKRVKR